MEGRTRLSLQTARELERRFGHHGDGLGEYARLLPLATLVRLPRQLMAPSHDLPAATIARAERRHDEAIALLRKAPWPCRC